jgi:hypothetical protein
MSLAISQYTEDYISNLVLTPLEIVFNKPHPSILLHIKDATTQQVLILLFQETKHDIIFRHAQLQTQRRREELHPCIQARLVSVVNKIIALLEYQGVLQYSDSLSLLSSRFVDPDLAGPEIICNLGSGSVINSGSSPS